jgi:hypothetical protein
MHAEPRAVDIPYHAVDIPYRAVDIPYHPHSYVAGCGFLLSVSKEKLRERDHDVRSCAFLSPRVLSQMPNARNRTEWLYDEQSGYTMPERLPEII